MDFKKIAHAAVCRWNEKRHTDKTSDPRRISLPEAAPAVREVASLKAASLESSLGDFLAECYEFRFNVLTEATEFRCLTDKENGTFRLGRGTHGAFRRRKGIPSLPAVFPTAPGMGWTRPTSRTGRPCVGQSLMGTGFPPVDARTGRTMGRTLRRTART